MEGEPHDASILMAIEAAEFFSLRRQEAEKIVGETAHKVQGQWRACLEAAGVAGDEARRCAMAFEHDELEKALSFPADSWTVPDLT